jgi:hypothetical protein
MQLIYPIFHVHRNATHSLTCHAKWSIPCCAWYYRLVRRLARQP